jgi:hypothetical protein
MARRYRDADATCRARRHHAAQDQHRAGAHQEPYAGCSTDAAKKGTDTQRPRHHGEWVAGPHIGKRPRRRLGREPLGANER